MASADPTKYEQVSKENDIDDFYLFISFKNREKNIEKFFMDQAKDGNSNTQSTNKKTFDNPQDAMQYFKENKV